MKKDKEIHDLIIIGAGPSALSAAIYTAREDFDTLLIERSSVGGLAALTDKIDNYPGFPDGITGYDLTENFKKQAEKFGAVIKTGNVTAIRDDGEFKTLNIDGEGLRARSVLIATGSQDNKLNIPGEDEYYGKGVHYCATCDGAFYRGKNIAVVGGANSAIQETIFLTKFAEHIDLIVRSTIKAAEVLQHELQKYVDAGKITVHLGTTPLQFNAVDDHIVSVSVDKDGDKSDINIDGAFIFAGFKPSTSFLVNSDIELDENGYVKTDGNYQTNVAGIFASGDVRSGSVKQVAVAVGEGATVAKRIREYLKSVTN